MTDPALRAAFLDGIAWMSERTYLSNDGGYHVAEPSERDIRRAADEYGGRPKLYTDPADSSPLQTGPLLVDCVPGKCHCEMKGQL